MTLLANCNFPPPPPEIPPSVYRDRQQKLAKKIGNGLVIQPTAPRSTRSRDTQYPYRPDSNFWYLSGFPEPQAVLILEIRHHICEKSCLFCHHQTEQEREWEGCAYTPQTALEHFAIDDSQPITQLSDYLKKQLNHHTQVRYDAWKFPEYDAVLAPYLQQFQLRNKERTVLPLAPHVHALRQIKDCHEIAHLTFAAQVSAQAHRLAMQSCQPGQYEYQISALLQYAMQLANTTPGYSSIVAGGKNACFLHYTHNNQPLAAHDLLLIDAGGEYQGYCADITRTFPVNGKFSSVQKDLLAVVLAAQYAAIDATQMGASFQAPHQAALLALCEGLSQLGILSGSPETLCEQNAYKPFYFHRTSHWLGLDVHDVGPYEQAGTAVSFEENMYLTIEPGLYIRPAENVPKHFWNIGIRIEDDILVTQQEPKVLSQAVPKTAQEIEHLMHR